jgi:hypothetical protein
MPKRKTASEKTKPSGFEPYEGLSAEMNRELEKIQEWSLDGARRSRERDLS